MKNLSPVPRSAHREPPFEPPPSPVPDPAEPPAPEEPLDMPSPADRPHPVAGRGRAHRCARRGLECLPRQLGPARGPVAAHHAHVRGLLWH